MEGNTPFRLWKCVLCGVELDEADGDFPVIIERWNYCEICSKKAKQSLTINEYKDAVVVMGVWANQYRKEAEGYEAELSALKSLLREMGEIILLCGQILLKIKDEGYKPKTLILEKIYKILNRPEVVKILKEAP